MLCGDCHGSSSVGILRGAEEAEGAEDLLARGSILVRLLYNIGVEFVMVGPEAFGGVV